MGLMGKPMATRLEEAGYTVLREGRGVHTPSEVVVTMLPDTPDVLSVWGALAPKMTPEALAIDMSTVAPSAAREISAILPCAFVDAPVSGGEAGAKAGTLSIMAGGSAEAFTRAEPLLRAMGNTIVHAGNVGAGQTVKLVNQIVNSLNLLATVEGLRVAKAAGLDLTKTIKAVSQGAAGSWMMANLGPKMVAGDIAPGFRLRLHCKDLRLANELIAELGLHCPGTALTDRIFSAALKQGLGEQGNQALFYVDF
jgi:3-hydroxyisobutyrate dehydrogenase-like beta-hydroxyacid dehydrogenase